MQREGNVVLGVVEIAHGGQLVTDRDCDSVVLPCMDDTNNRWLIFIVMVMILNEVIVWRHVSDNRPLFFLFYL